MEDRRTLSSPERRRDAAPAAALPFADQREQVRRFLGELIESTEAAEAEIASSVRRLLEDVGRRQSTAGGNAKELAAREAHLVEEAQRLQHEVDEARRKQSRVEEKLRRLEEQEEELERERQRTKSQRRRIAAELRDDRDAVERERRRAVADLQTTRDELARLQADLERRGVELTKQKDDLQRRVAEVEARAAELTAPVAAPSEDPQLRAELENRRRELDELMRRYNDAHAQRAEARCEVDRLREREMRLERRWAEAAEAEQELARLREENAALRRSGQEGPDAEELASLRDAAAELQTLRQLYDDLREDAEGLRRRLATSEKKRPAKPRAAAPASDAAMDWESQKRRLLEALETDFDPDDADDCADRLTIEGTIQITDNVVQQKDREIAELQRRLEEQSMASTPGLDRAALDSAIDQDEAVREYRKQVEALKEEWETKCRSAEVELSIERAKLARERSALEERRAEIDAQAKHAGTSSASPATREEPKKGGGRWLARLGLRDTDG